MNISVLLLLCAFDPLLIECSVNSLRNGIPGRRSGDIIGHFDDVQPNVVRLMDEL